jgi:hypothetical protein
LKYLNFRTNLVSDKRVVAARDKSISTNEALSEREIIFCQFFEGWVFSRSVTAGLQHFFNGTKTKTILSVSEAKINKKWFHQTQNRFYEPNRTKKPFFSVD